MLDGISLDQLRTLVAAADEGSFSAAGRRLQRAQSAVSENIANLESQLGVTLFDRAGRYPKLTVPGAVLLADARAVVGGIDGMKARAKGMAGGLEPQLTAVIDVFYPIKVVADAAKAFRTSFPATPLRLYVEALGATVQPVVDGRASFGLVGSLPNLPKELIAERIGSIVFVMVAAVDHPLAACSGVISRDVLTQHVQLVLTDRTDFSAGREFGVFSHSTWRLADLFAKHAFLLNGLGWGGMPRHVVQQDISDGRLVELAVEDVPAGGFVLPMSVAYRRDDPPGPAGRWMIEQLKQNSGFNSATTGLP